VDQIVNQMVNSVGFTVSCKQLALQIAAAPILSPRRAAPYRCPRSDPLFDLAVGDRFAAIERCDRSLDPGDLAFVDVEILRSLCSLANNSAEVDRPIRIRGPLSRGRRRNGSIAQSPRVGWFRSGMLRFR